jgi:hypothetical protein
MTSLTEGGTEVVPQNRAELVQRAFAGARTRQSEQSNDLFRTNHATGLPTSLGFLERPKAFVGVGSPTAGDLSIDWSAPEAQ